MQPIVLAVLAVLVAFVTIDSRARGRAAPPPRDPTTASTQKIRIDWSRRR